MCPTIQMNTYIYVVLWATLQVATTLDTMVTRILALATTLKLKSPARQLKSM